MLRVYEYDVEAVLVLLRGFDDISGTAMLQDLSYVFQWVLLGDQRGVVTCCMPTECCRARLVNVMRPNEESKQGL